MAKALRALHASRRALADWAAALGPKEIFLAEPRSFCAGVRRAIETVERALERYGPPVYVRRQIVHNAHVVARLEAAGAVFVQELDEVPDGANVVFSAHGVGTGVRDEAGSRQMSTIDATCPLVTKVHTEARAGSAGPVASSSSLATPATTKSKGRSGLSPPLPWSARRKRWPPSTLTPAGQRHF